MKGSDASERLKLHDVLTGSNPPHLTQSQTHP